MRQFFFKSYNEFSNSSIAIKEDSFHPINLQSILSRMLRRVIVLSPNNGQFDSISIAQLQRRLIQFWKLWLNLRSRRRLSLRRSRVISLIPLWLWQLKKPLGLGLKNLRILKIPKLSEFRIAGSGLFHSINVFEKNMFNFNQRNAIKISRSIKRCKKPSIFENFLVVESFFWPNYRLTVQSGDYTKIIPPGMCSWKTSAWTVPSIFEYFFRK